MSSLTLRGTLPGMPDLMLDTPHKLLSENARLRAELARLRAENIRLREANHELRAALATHVNRARTTATYGPLELTAGTCVGPRRRRHGKGG